VGGSFVATTGVTFYIKGHGENNISQPLEQQERKYFSFNSASLWRLSQVKSGERIKFAEYCELFITESAAPTDYIQFFFYWENDIMPPQNFFPGTPTPCLSTEVIYLEK